MIFDAAACRATPGNRVMTAPAAPPAPLGPSASAPLDVLWVDVPAGRVESDPDHHHVLDMHAGNPVRVSCRLDGRESRGAQLHGDINVLPAGSTGRWLMQAPANAVIVRLSPALFEQAADAMSLKSARAQLQPAIRMRDPHIEHIGWMLKEEISAGSPRGRLWRDSVAYTLALRLLRRSQESWSSLEANRRALPKWRLRSVCEYIEAHLEADLSLAELAAVAGFSVPHFKVLFRQSMGVPAHRYVVERRVERARQLLLHGNRSMADIAHAVGFTHQSHMIRCVHRVLGISPAQIVALCR
jgi:AraC family transcriptional regulator